MNEASIPRAWNTYAICAERCGWVTEYAVWGKPLSPRCCPTCGAQITVIVGRWYEMWIPNIWYKHLFKKGYFLKVKFESRDAPCTGKYAQQGNFT